MTTFVIAITVILLIAWAGFLGWHYQETEDQKNAKDKEDYFILGAVGAIFIAAWPITLVMAAIGGIMYGIAAIARKITKECNGYSTKG